MQHLASNGNGNGRPTVLVVDDDADMRLLLGLYAAEAGYTVVDRVDDGQKAVEAWQSARASGQPLNAIVLDQMMPNLTGLEAAAVIREHDHEVVLVLISAAMSPGLADAAKGAGVSHALSKSDLRNLTSVLSA